MTKKRRRRTPVAGSPETRDSSPSLTDSSPSLEQARDSSPALDAAPASPDAALSEAAPAAPPDGAPVPALPGRGPELRLYDTADRQVRPVAPGPKATMYVCGITPYDATHLGHAATYLAFDLIHRLWLDLGHDVHYVQNVTDVDDPLFERADRDGVDWRELAEQEVALFRADMEALRVLPPHEYVGATEAVPEMVEVWRPGGRSEDRRPHGDRNRHRHQRHQDRPNRYAHL